MRAARSAKQAKKALPAASRVVLFCAILDGAVIGLSLVRFWQKIGKGAALVSSQRGFTDAARPARWRSPQDAAPRYGLPAVIKCNSMVVAPAGCARRGGDRTEAQRAAAARNLLHQVPAATGGALDDEQPGSPSPAARSGRNGYMGKATRAKVKTLVDTMIFLNQLPEASRQTLNERLGYKQQACYLTFVTLTLPADQLRDAFGEFDDEHAKRQLLRPFIERLRYTFGVQAFIWVGEPQEAGNIHFHLLIDKYINNTKNPENEEASQQLTKAWNQILARHGYIDAYAQAQRARHAGGFAFDPEQRRRVEVFDAATGRYTTTMEAVSYADQVEAYAYGEATSWQNPNTVDIHKLKAQNNVKAYLCKYLTKNDGSDTSRRKIGGNLWGAADLLRDVGAYKEEFGDELRQALVNMSAAVPGSVRCTLVTPEGNFTLEEYEDNELAGRVPVLATIYTYSQSLFWKFAPWGFRHRFTAYYRDAFRRIYTPELAARPPGFGDETRRQAGPVPVLA